MLRGQTGFSSPRNVRIVYVVQPRPICSRVCPITIEYADVRRVFTARIVLWCNALIAAVWGSPVEGQKCREEWLFRTLCASEVGGGGWKEHFCLPFNVR